MLGLALWRWDCALACLEGNPHLSPAHTPAAGLGNHGLNGHSCPLSCRWVARLWVEANVPLGGDNLCTLYMACCADCCCCHLPQCLGCLLARQHLRSYPPRIQCLYCLVPGPERVVMRAIHHPCRVWHRCMTWPCYPRACLDHLLCCLAPAHPVPDGETGGCCCSRCTHQSRLQPHCPRGRPESHLYLDGMLAHRQWNQPGTSPKI